MMRMGVPTKLVKEKLTPVELSLYEDAPHRPTLVDVYNKKEGKNGKIKQITRKPLIIIWMMANEEKEFMPRVHLINGILEECGMPKLDSKNPFDWIVLNALESDGIARMEDIIQNIFEKTAVYATLYVMKEGIKARGIPIDKDIFVIGRNRAEVDCCFDSDGDLNISRKHCKISWDGGYYLTHISATEGVYTYINSETKLGYREEVALNSGDVIKIGNRELMFEFVEEEQIIEKG